MILNTGSVLARHPQRDYFATAGYAASKGAIEAMSVAAAAYYAPEGIRINVIAPGLVHTPMTARAQGNARDHRIHDPQTADDERHVDTQRISPRPHAFFLRKDSSPITGQIMTVMPDGR